MWNHLIDWIEQLAWQLLHIGQAIGQAAIIMTIAVILGNYARRFIVRNLSAKSFGRNGALMVGRTVSTMFLIIGVLVVIGNLGASWTGLLTFVSAGTVAISLSIQDVLKNFVAGVYLLLERPFRVGDKIAVRTVVGEVQGIDIRTTLVRSDTGELVMIPNSIMFSEILQNRSHFAVRRIEFTISQTTDTVHDIERNVAEALHDIPGVRLPIPAPRITGSKPEGRTMILNLIVDQQPKQESEIIERVLSVLAGANVEVTSS
jgi:small-conductance mechanosensitive channel